MVQSLGKSSTYAGIYLADGRKYETQTGVRNEECAVALAVKRHDDCHVGRGCLKVLFCLVK